MKNTIYHWLTDDLKLLNESQVILEDDTDTLTKCDLQPTTYAVTNGELCIPIDIFNTGDIASIDTFAHELVDKYVPQVPAAR